MAETDVPDDVYAELKKRQKPVAGNIQFEASETVIPTARVSAGGTIVAPPRAVVRGVEDVQDGGIGYHVKSVRNKDAQVGVILVSKVDGMQMIGPQFEPDETPVVKHKPLSARKMDGFGDAELAQIIKYRSTGKTNMHLYRTVFPENVMAFQVEKGALLDHIVIVVQKYQAWEQSPVWGSVVTISEETGWAIGGAKWIEAHIKGFVRAVQKRHGEA